MSILSKLLRCLNLGKKVPAVPPPCLNSGHLYMVVLLSTFWEAWDQISLQFVLWQISLFLVCAVAGCDRVWRRKSFRKRNDFFCDIASLFSKAVIKFVAQSVGYLTSSQKYKTFVVKFSVLCVFLKLSRCLFLLVSTAPCYLSQIYPTYRKKILCICCHSSLFRIHVLRSNKKKKFPEVFLLCAYLVVRCVMLSQMWSSRSPALSIPFKSVFCQGGQFVPQSAKSTLSVFVICIA